MQKTSFLKRTTGIFRKNDGLAKPFLADLSADIILIAVVLQNSADYGEVKSFRQSLMQEIENWETKCYKAGVNSEAVNLSKYALVAFLDEVIISSSWQHQSEWLTQPLQREIYGKFDAGVRFFDRLQELMRNRQADILSIYYMCLALGYKGKYRIQDKAELARISVDVRKILNKYHAMELAPNWRQRFYYRPVNNPLPIWLSAIGVFVFSIFIYLILSFLIDDVASSVQATMSY